MIPSYVWTIVFYSIIILLLIIFKKKFVRQGIIFLLRTKIGLKFINKFAKKHREAVRLFGLTGIGVAVVGLIAIVYILVSNLIKIITNPEAQSGVSLVLPGVHIPGSPITIPLITGWIALLIVMVVHEFSHGIVAKAYDLEVKNSGLAFLGPIAGAFVEPDEKKLVKSEDNIQYAIYSAGPVSNIIVGLIAFLVLSWFFIPVTNLMTTPVGFSVGEVQSGFPAKESGLRPGMVISEINNVPVRDYSEFANEMSKVKPGETIEIKANGSIFTITTTKNPNDETKAYIGISSLKNERVLKSESSIALTFFAIYKWIEELFFLLFVLSLGIGMANLLPLGPIDGGRILQTASAKIFGNKKGYKVWAKISLLTLMLLLINIMWPLFRWLILKI